MDTGLAGKIALVCGASRGLGRATAAALAAEGCRVALVARHEAVLTEAAVSIARATGADVLPIVADVSKADDARRIVREASTHFGGLDILVGNAGGPRAGGFDALTEDDWLQAVELTLMSAVRVTTEAVPIMRKRGGGRIIHITSVAAKQPVDNLMLSNTIRPAVIGFAKSLATELAKDKITVNCVAPGYIRTDRIVELTRSTAARDGVTPDVIESRMVEEIPMGRIGEPDEFAALMVFLASARASYLTGCTLQVDGGLVKSLF